jgi:hypothetical protein
MIAPTAKGASVKAASSEKKYVAKQSTERPNSLSSLTFGGVSRINQLHDTVSVQGLWSRANSLGRLRTKTPTVRSATATHTMQVEQKLAEARGDAARGIVYDAENMIVREWLTTWLQDSVKGNVGPGTYHQYGVHVRHHVVPALGRVKLSRLTAAHVQSIYAQKLRDGLAPATVRLTHAVLHRALAQAVRFNLIPSNPAQRVDPPKVRQDEITPLDSEQARALLDAGKGDRLEALYVLSLSLSLSHRRFADRRSARVEVERHRPRHRDAARQPSATAVHR